MRITYNIYKSNPTNFKIDYTVAGFARNDVIEIFYSKFNWNNNSWGPEIKIKNPYSYKIPATRYYNLSETLNFFSLGGGRYRFKFVVLRNNIGIYTVFSEPTDTSTRVNAPSLASLNTSNTTISWFFSANAEDLPLSHFIIQCVYLNPNRTVQYRINRTVSKNVRQYQFNNLSPGNVIFFIRAVDESNRESPIVQVNNTPHRILRPPSNSEPSLFDKESWVTAAITEQLGGASHKFLQAMDTAADRWSTFIKFNPVIYKEIKEAVELNSSRIFNGIYLHRLGKISGGDDASARCGPSTFHKISDIKYNTISFDLYIKSSILSWSSEELADLFTHELGHALGIGVYWQPEFANTLDTDPKSIFPYSINEKKNIIYPQAQNAYNNYFNIRRKYIPINNSGLGQGWHWAHVTNSSTPFRGKHPAPDYDIMSYGDLQRISLLSIKYLVDIGYEEKNPNTSELDVLLANNIQQISLFNTNPVLSCGGLPSQPPIILTEKSDDYITIYDQNLQTDQIIDDFDDYNS